MTDIMYQFLKKNTEKLVLSNRLSLDQKGKKMKKILKGNALEKYAIKLGIDIEDNSITQSVSGRNKRASDSELQKRVFEAERSIRENRLWLVALISSIASVISAASTVIIFFIVFFL